MMTALLEDRNPVTNDATTMKAIVQREYGDAPEQVLRLAEVPTPVPGDDEVLVRVHAASVDLGTWHLMTGRPYVARVALGLRRPKVTNPGRSLAGTVEAVGKNVAGFAIGDEVYGSADSSFAEYARVATKRLAHKPANLTFEAAASAPISAGTALQAVRDKGKVQAGQKVLIVGAAGGVGSFAVQIAKAYGAEVTGVASTAKLDLVHALGADHVIDYTQTDFTRDTERYDVIIDTGGQRRLSDLRRALTPKGTLVIVGGETDERWLGGTDRLLRAPLMSLFVSQRISTLASRELGTDFAILAKMFEANEIVAPIDRSFTLGEVPDAIRYLAEHRVRGKVVITI
jgi:NADPH:quinone reductase-like Zn-dependent oxidoreductase